MILDASPAPVAVESKLSDSFDGRIALLDISAILRVTCLKLLLSVSKEKMLACARKSGAQSDCNICFTLGASNAKVA